MPRLEIGPYWLLGMSMNSKWSLGMRLDSKLHLGTSFGFGWCLGIRETFCKLLLLMFCTSFASLCFFFSKMNNLGTHCHFLCIHPSFLCLSAHSPSLTIQNAYLIKKKKKPDKISEHFFIVSLSKTNQNVGIK